MTTDEERLREWATMRGALKVDMRPRMCSGPCIHPDCSLSRALLAGIDKGNERFKRWRIHRNDSPELGQDMWQEVISAMCRAVFPEDK